MERREFLKKAVASSVAAALPVSAAIGIPFYSCDDYLLPVRSHLFADPGQCWALGTAMRNGFQSFELLIDRPLTDAEVAAYKAYALKTYGAEADPMVITHQAIP